MLQYTLDIYIDYLITSMRPSTATGFSKLYEGAVSNGQAIHLLANSYLNVKDLWLKPSLQFVR